MTFNLGTVVNGHRFWAGLANTIGNADFNSTDVGVNCVGIGFHTVDSTGWYLYNNDAIGTPTKTLISGMARNITGVVTLNIEWSLTDFNVKVYTTDIPAITTLLGWRYGRGTGAVASQHIMNFIKVECYQQFNTFDFSI